MSTSATYPTHYGYIEITLGEDGDLLDALVILETPTFPGCLIMSRPIVVYQMTGKKNPVATRSTTAPNIGNAMVNPSDRTTSNSGPWPGRPQQLKAAIPTATTRLPHAPPVT